MGHRAGGRTRVDATTSARCIAPEVEPRWGTPVASYVAEHMPDAEESPETEARKAVSNPRMRV
jgi:hypothetical protein